MWGATRQFVREVAEPYLKHTGGAISPFNAWIMLNGLSTLELRVRAMADTALTLAQALEGAGVRVIYPGLAGHPQHALAMRQMGSGGTMIALDLGTKAAAFAALNRMALVSISNNLGDAKSIATHPATTTHQRLSEDDRAAMGIGPGLIRLSVGLEHADDLAADILGAIG
ncbi:PLP-dependent transferase [Paracoccus sanguinis]|uniref:PLP-dependent transferase n=1 Tax=Paracoccus sanguinis TaxID=1545044 RepID=UPI000689B78E